MTSVNIGIIGGGLMGREMASAFARWCALTDVSVRPALVAVADLAVAADHAAAPGEPSWRIEWQGRGLVTESDAFAGRWSVHPPIG